MLLRKHKYLVLAFRHQRALRQTPAAVAFADLPLQRTSRPTGEYPKCLSPHPSACQFVPNPSVMACSYLIRSCFDAFRNEINLIVSASRSVNTTTMIYPL